jgi:uncharacterized protein
MELWFFAVAFAAQVIGTVAGFGSALILLPVALLFLDFKTALVLVAFMHLFGSLSEVVLFRNRIVWRMFAYFGFAGIGFTFLGAMLVPHIHQNALLGLLGGFLIAYALFMLVEPHFHSTPSRSHMVLGGATSGFLTGLIGTGGAIRSAFLTSFRMSKEKYVATAAAIAIVVDGTRIPIYIKDGLLDEQYYWMLPVLLVLAIIGSIVGKRLLSKIPQGLFTKIVLACLLLAGGKFVFDYFS